MRQRFQQRISLVLLVFAIQSLYLPLNHWLHQGVLMRTDLDNYIPLWPIWIVAYALCWPFWISAFLGAAWFMDDQIYRALMIGAMVTVVTAMLIFVVYPTCVERPVVPGSDWAARALRSLYSIDGECNAFPSGHVYLTTLLCLFWNRQTPRLSWFWASSAVAISLSTVFVGQHYLLDILGGLVLAWGCYRLGLWWVATPGISTSWFNDER